MQGYLYQQQNTIFLEPFYELIIYEYHMDQYLHGLSMFLRHHDSELKLLPLLLQKDIHHYFYLIQSIEHDESMVLEEMTRRRMILN
jgi:hypothetical protein